MGPLASCKECDNVCVPGGGGGGVVAPSFGSDCETDCESGGGDKQR